MNKNSWLDSFKRNIEYKLSKKGYKLIRIDVEHRERRKKK